MSPIPLIAQRANIGDIPLNTIISLRNDNPCVGVEARRDLIPPVDILRNVAWLPVGRLRRAVGCRSHCLRPALDSCRISLSALLWRHIIPPICRLNCVRGIAGWSRLQGAWATGNHL